MKNSGRILLLTVFSLILGGRAEAKTQVYLQDWEGATTEEQLDGWISKYDLTIGPEYDPIELVTDATAPSPSTAHRVMRVDGATNYLSPLIPVYVGESCSVGAWIRWESGGWPFVGISRYNSAGSPIGLPLYDPTTAPRIIWLVGPDWYLSRAGYDPPGSLVDPVAINYGWRWYEKEFTVPEGTGFVRITTELFKAASREGNPLAYFDDIAMYALPPIFFVEPFTPADGATIETSAVEIKTKIIESASLSQVAFEWDGTNYPLYDSSLVLMYNFDNIRALGEDYEGTNAVPDGLVKDVSPAGNDGYLGITGSPSTVPVWMKYGRHGGAFDFTGDGGANGQSIHVPHSASLNPGAGDFAVVFWILTRDDFDGDVLRKGSTLTAPTWYKVEHAPGGDADNLYLNFNTDGTDATITSTNVYNDNRWHFVVAQRNGSQAELWIDGVLDITTAVSGNISNTANLAVGSKDTQDDDTIDSALDEIRIYMTSFGQAEIEQFYYSNLSKYDLDKWLLYVNQSNLTNGSYLYQSSATDVAEPPLPPVTITTEVRNLTVALPDVPLKGPYLQNVTQDSVVIMWETAAPTIGQVDYGLAAPVGFSIAEAVATTIHEVQLTGLTPDTTYYYTATWDGLTSITSTFATAPAAPRSFRFVAYGDTRTNPDRHAAVAQAIINSEPEFVLHSGDLVANGGTYSEWETQFFAPARELMIHTPMYPVLGNHEQDPSWFDEFFSLPDNGSAANQERWYAFTYGNVRFIGLDTSFSSYSTGSEQYNWLVAEFHSNEYSSADWHIVFFHDPPYTASSSHVDNEIAKTYLVPLFERYGVHMVFSGHTHAYERYFNNGVYYIVTGGGGAPLHTLLTDSVEPIRQFGESVDHHCVIDVGVPSETLTLRARYNTGEEFDSVTLTKPPTETSFRFTVSCDNRPINGWTIPYWQQVCDAMTANVGDEGVFHLMPGDFDDPETTDLELEAEFGSDVIWYPVVGNHEAETPADMTWVRNAFPSLPGVVNSGPSGCETTTYSFDYGNAHFIALNVYYNGTSDTGTDGDVVNALYNWLVDDLAANTKPVVFVIGHEPAYPQIRHIDDSLDQYPANRDRFWKLLNDEEVIAYFTGHTHYYSALQQAQTGTYPCDAYTWQVDAGNSGNFPNTTEGLTFVDVTVRGTTVSFDTWRQNDAFPAWTLLETWTVDIPELVVAHSPSPADGAEGVSTTSLTLSATVNNPSGTADPVDVTFYGREKPSFAIVALPDTQNYVNLLDPGTPEIFTSQTQWIVENAVTSNIVFVTHEGDITDNTDRPEQGDVPAEWERANTSMSVLDGVVPYGLLPGNHDYPTTYYNSYFPYTRYESNSWYGGHYDTTNDHNYQLFSAGGDDYIIIHLGYNPSGDVITWANGILNLPANSGHKAIITTHSYLNTNGTLTTDGGTAIWNDLVVPNNNVFFVLCGHNSGEMYVQGTVDGRTVHQLLANYQARTNGGDGWLRIMRFEPDEDMIYVETYSPWLDAYEVDDDSYFALDFDMTGIDYTGIGTNTGVPTGTSTSVSWPGLSMETEYEWYVTVTDIAPDPDITMAGPLWSFTTGSLKAGNPNPANGATGVDIDADLSWTAGIDSVSHDVYFGTDTASLPLVSPEQAGTTYDPGTLNQGVTYYWAIDEHDSGVGVTAGDVWSFTTTAPGPVTFQQGVNGYTGAVDTMIHGGHPTNNYSGDPIVTVDGDDGGAPSQVLLRFDDIIGSGPGQVPSGSTILSATLRLRSLDDGNGGDLHRLLQSWVDTTVTWDNSFGGNGVQANDTDAVSAADDGITVNSPNTDVDLDVAATVQIWVDGADNYGWALLPNGTNGWDIATAEHATSDYRPELIISFTPPASQLASDPNPSDGATQVAIDADLSWTAGTDAVSHDVYFGTADPPAFVQNQTETTYDPGLLLPSTTYYWQIDERDAGSGVVTGDLWSFTTATAKATNPDPANGATNVGINADLSWTAGVDAVSHDVYFGTDAGSLALVSAEQAGTTYDPGTLDQGLTYYWAIDERDSLDAVTVGDIWSFTTTPPSLPHTEDFDSGFTLDETVGSHSDWFDGGSGPVVTSGIGVAGSVGLGQSGTICTWTAHPFVWTEVSKVIIGMDFQTDGSAHLDDDRVGWMISNSSTNSSDIFGVQLDPGGSGYNIEGYWDGSAADRRPSIVDLPTLSANTWYRLRAEFTRLTDTSAAIDVELWSLDAGGNPVGLIVEGSIADTSTLGADAPHSKYFPGTNLWPGYKNHTAVAGAVDNAYFEEVPAGPPDTTPPVITSETGNTTATTGDPVSIEATITDADDAVASATVYYTPIGGSETSVSMTEGGSNVWTGLVAVAVDAIGDITYYITAQDPTGNSSRVPSPTGTYAITVTDDDAPTISGATGNIPADTDDTIAISATITDNIDVTGATLYYTPVDAGETSLAMTEGASDLWSVSIPTGPDEGAITYYIIAEDAVPNTATDPPTGSYTITVTEPDIAPPVITGETGDTAGTTGDPIAIEATITDVDDVVASATVHYTPIGGSETSVSMTEGASDVWSALVPVAIDKVGDITYYITAQDPATNSARAPSPTGTYAITVTDDDVPTISGATGNVSADTDDTVPISATITDNIDVVGATLYYTPVGGSETLLPMSEGANDLWSASVPTGSLEGDISYYIIAGDAVLNTVTDPPTGSYTITVTTGDITPPVITGVASSNVTDSSATITWTTDEDSDSLVTYDTVAPPTANVDSDPTMVTTHLLTLTGLSAGTVYFYEVESADAVGNTATDSNSGEYYKFATEGTLFYDDFESGVLDTAWVVTGNNAAVVSGASYNSNYGVKIAKNTSITTGINTSGFQSIHLKYVRTTSGMDSGESLSVDWRPNGGSDWINLETTQATTWAQQDWLLPAGATSTDFEIRFLATSNNAAEYAYIDNVEITGTPVIEIAIMTTSTAGMAMLEDGTMHVEAIVVSAVAADGGVKKGEAQVVILDSTGSPVSGAIVTGMFSEDISERVVALTNGNGMAVLQTTATAAGRCHLTFVVNSVGHHVLYYNPTQNVVTSADNR